MGQNWDKFLLLTWKNWLLQWRHPIQTSIEILAPVLFAALLVLVRGLVTPEEKPQRLFDPFQLDSFTPIPFLFNRVAWSPCNNSAIDTVMKNVAAQFNFATNSCYNDSQALENALWDNMNTVTLAGVQFSDSLAGRTDLNENLEVIIRFPSELRNTSSSVVSQWRTNLIFPLYQVPGPREPELNNGAQPDEPQQMNLESDEYEKEPTNYNIGIQINKLTKVFSGKKVAVRSVSFNMFENQITVLLGHNGAGKTTTMSMLTGMLTPTEGTAIVNGYDIRTNMSQVRDSLGLCPQHNILFDDLTVAEHLRFFSKLKGLNKKETDEEINTYVELLQLVPKRNARSKTLSGGMKRKLSVAIAMCGRSKIVMLDEPTAGMDPAARRALWDMIVATNIGSELTYILAEDQASVFEKMLNDIENRSTSLGINSYGISLTTMEEVFMKVGADHGQEEINNGEVINNGNMVKNGQLTNYHETDTDSAASANSSENSRINIASTGFVSGYNLWRNQFAAMVMKKFRVTQRNWILVLIQNIIPIAFIIITMIVSRMMNIGIELPSISASLDPFTDPITAITRDSETNPYYLKYLNILGRENREIRNFSKESMTDSMLTQTAQYTARVRMRYIIGASFFGNNIISWFNNEPYHSPPIALQYSMNAILQSHTTDNHSIQFFNYPLPFSTDTRITQMNTGQTMGFQIAFNMAFCMAFVTPFYVLFYVRERVIKSKHQQFVSGAKVSAYWLANMLWDFTTFLLTIICTIITLVCFQEDGFSTASDLGIKIKSAALYMVVQALGMESLELGDVADILHWIFSVSPHYSLAVAFTNMSNLDTLMRLCDTISQATGVYPACEIVDLCCFEENYFHFNNIGGSLIYMGGIAIIAFCLLFLVEYRIFDRLIYSCKKNISSVPTIEDTDDSDVLEEKRRVRTGEIQPGDYEVVLKDLTKQYSNFFAVNQLCLGIKGYECFGLLGVNGAGKTTTFKMMTGDVVMSHGNGWIRNFNMQTQMKQVQKNVGYCPQFDALLDDLTGKETLIMYCLLRGLPFMECKYIAMQLAKEFDFYRHLDKQVKAYSGGNKRKLSSAIALIGDPAIVFLDEPTAGMDPSTKRNLWNTLCRIRDSGKCLVLTSHSMEECEALCTRLAIMVNGAFKCLGSTQHLKNKFSEGYMLTVKVKKSGGYLFNDENIVPIERYIQTHFPSAILKENHQELLTYFIPDTSLPWSKMFGIMERGKREIDNLEDYSLGQSSLEQFNMRRY
ncbi:atp-binding cassette transporter subfamily a abca [Holotrichia oblita]|uniref:Atp-binding cassette transporter subfamily a abca n=1 Tax=Holotrichia oblita TaxID=644536 RepID=A0ACB9SRM3_HOLOL|nr:atp-binding cassette transporter subfamily a abca [Holotrichia oblita]